jgi:hypothetical protein
MREASHTVSLDEFIDHLPFYTHVRVAPGAAGARYFYHELPLISFTWIAPWALSFSEYLDYTQLDGSFKGAWPYVYSTPQGIQSNEALPLGLSMGFTEDHALFQHFHDDLRALVRPGRSLPKRPVLSDKGGGIRAFCLQNQLWQLFCHRHLIENAKANSPLGFLIARALREPSHRSYQEHRPQYIADAAELKQVGLLTEDQHATFLSFLTEDFPDGLWHRIPDAISSCTNHAERFHGVINQHLSTRSTLPERLDVIRTEIEKKYKQFGQGRHRQISDVICHLRSCHARQSLDCDDLDCRDYRILMASRYRVANFPCRHTVSAWDIAVVRPLSQPPCDHRTPQHLITQIVLNGPLPPKFQCKSLVPDAADHEIREGINQMPSWNDGIALGSGADASDDGKRTLSEEWERADRRIAYDIVDGVLYFRRRPPHSQNLGRAGITLAVWADLECSLEQAGVHASRLVVAAQCTARWWLWARERGRERPFPPFGWSLRPDDPEWN